MTTIPTPISTDINHLPTPPPISLQFADLSYHIKLPNNNNKTTQMPLSDHKTILHGITGEASSGQLLAVLGPSGSGKSTLLTILAGRSPGHHAGILLANGARFTRSLTRRIGFVPQEDSLLPHLTVRETLTYCAMLRFPRLLSDRADRIRRAVDAVLGELGLAGCGDTEVRGVSGGERKRVSIGHEMLLDPSVVVVDEATSGLDATAAGRMLEMLAGIARKGRTVVASVHQPSTRGYRMFDAVLLLGEGRCLYYGKGCAALEYFGAVGFSPELRVNPAEFLLDLANGITRSNQHPEAEEKAKIMSSLISSYNTLLAPRVKSSITAIAKSSAAANGRHMKNKKETKDLSRISWLSQFTILLRRSLRERRHESFNHLRTVQVIAAALLAGLTWWRSSIVNVRDRLGLLFFISIFWGVFSSVNAVFTFPQEHPIFVKERASGMYSVSSYFLARSAGDLPGELILPSIFLALLYWMAGLRPELGAFLLTLLVLLCYVLVARGMGLAVGAAVMDAKQASTIVTITMLAFLMTGGFYVQNVPKCMVWMKYGSFTFYGYRLLIGVQYRGDEMRSYLGMMGSDHLDRRVADIEGQVGIMTSVMALGVMFVGYRFLAYAALRRIKCN